VAARPLPPRRAWRMDRSVLAERLRDRGFKVVQPLKSASGHAVIFRVQETEEPEAQPYVAKVVSLTGLDAKGRASAQQEVSLLKGLSAHPNLIAYRESFVEEAGILYIVMTLAEDGDLRLVVTESQLAKRAVPEPVVLTWLRQTLGGLRHLHSQGVVHRDLKSSNIFLSGGRRRILIGDFGISRVLESTAFASSVVGTPAYMSPELMRNERYDFHVDMWALGCIAFELCTLQLPFAARSLLELACQVMESEPVWSHWDGLDYSPEVLEVSTRLLSKDVAVRPSAAELLDEPFFSEGGRGAEPPSEEVWASIMVLGQAEDDLRTPDKRHTQSPMSQLTQSTAATGDSSSLSSKGGWTLTPCASSWAASGSGGSDGETPQGVSGGGALGHRVSGSDGGPARRRHHSGPVAETVI